MAESTLNTIAHTLKSNKILIVAVLATTTLAVLSFISSFTKKAPQHPPQQAVPWESTIFPGSTSKQSLEELQGKPQKIESQNNKEVYLYKTQNEYRFDSVKIGSDTVVEVKEQILSDDNRDLNYYLEKLGPEETMLFGGPSSFTRGFFWGKHGIIVFAGQFDKAIIEIWYFKPTTLEFFLQNHPELSKTETETID